MITVGVDEVGRGPIAGPVVAAAVVLTRSIDGLADSKVLGPAVREALYLDIKEGALIGVGASSTAEIERLNILHASLLAMHRAVRRLRLEPDHVLVDGNRAPDWSWPTECVIGGDASVPEISAASIVAKVVRDRLMRRLALRYAAYGWDTNAGYATPSHLAALAASGACRHHRRGFSPVAAALAATALRPSSGARAVPVSAA